MTTAGAVLSILIPLMVAKALAFPAASKQRPDALWLVPSVATTSCASHDTPPDVASVPANDTVTFVFRHPFEFDGGVATAVVVGGVASRLIVTDCVVVPPALVAEHATSTPGVSLVRLVRSQPLVDEIADSASSTVHVT